ncbi:MAG: hypothetical protein HC869_12955 [Rhodospirillales bacterium]|nr:hypothetical protein [Rhodospirillales bacterium]
MERDESRKPGRGEITVQIRAYPINYRNYAVVTGKLPAAPGRIPLSDGAGERAGPPEVLLQRASGLSVFDQGLIDSVPRGQLNHMTAKVRHFEASAPAVEQVEVEAFNARARELFLETGERRCCGLSILSWSS